MKTKTLRGLSSLCRELAERLHAGRHCSHLKALFQQADDQLFYSTHRELNEEQLADTLAQALLQARLAWVSADSRLHALGSCSEMLPASDSLLGQLLRFSLELNDGPQPPLGLDNEMRRLLSTAGSLLVSTNSSKPSVDSTVDSEPDELIDFDSFLNAHDPRGRSRHGVYFTPRTVASFIVREVDRLLTDEFQLANGLADTTTWAKLPRCGTDERVSHPRSNLPVVNVLDPAAGAGVFLIEVIDCVWKKLKLQWSGREADWIEAWNDYVVRHLLPRLHAIDLLLPSCAVAWIRIAEKLATTGYRFDNATPIKIELGDAFADPTNLMSRQEAKIFSVVLGNPPFSALTTSGNSWIDGLLRRTNLGNRQVGGYYEVDGAPLGEKKLWLHDDYVKFLRYGQWQIERAGCGIVGFVTNHGYLDNLTFRGVRRSLLNTFPRISLVDLHGGRKNREQAPDGGLDQNVFGIDQGVAIGIFRKPPAECQLRVARADLWGTRQQKSSALQEDSSLKWHSLSPLSPHYLFMDRQSTRSSQQEFDRGFPLDEIMPVHSTAAVTARDSFAVAFRQDELLSRMQQLADELTSDEDLRRRFFCRTRSRRYPSGDTRSWKLPEARQHARHATDLRSFVRRCLYRPFDWRWVFWADWMIDWPRNEIMRHMLGGDNLALITRRQMISQQPANYFFVADQIVIDGLIRSDNRGSESFFPLFLADSEPRNQPRPCNFSQEFLAAWAKIAGHENRHDPIDLFYMIYAQFHSEVYRERYRHELCLGFPRVFLPVNARLFRQLVEFGQRLVEAHLLRGKWNPTNGTTAPPQADAPATTIPQRGWPMHEDTTLWLNQDCSLTDVPREVWDFHIGGYQVCKKWLRDRAGRNLSEADVGQYAAITQALAETTHVMRDIDAAIEDAGNWPTAFIGRCK